MASWSILFSEVKHLTLACFPRATQLLLIGLYRSPHRRNDAQVPYVFTNPPGDSVLHAGDQMYVFGHPELAKEAGRAISLQLMYKQDGKVTMAQDNPTIR